MAVGRLGTVAAIGQEHLLALHSHPRLIDGRNGQEVMHWPQLRSGSQTTSIMMTDPELTPIAVDAVHRRFAVEDAEGITVVQIGAAPLD